MKKTLAYIAAIVLSFSIGTPLLEISLEASAESSTTEILGDVNGDGTIDIEDAVLVISAPRL